MNIIYKIIIIFLINISILKANDTQDITLQLNWKHQFQFAGYYMAKEKGFYKELGLNVNIKEHSANINTTQEIINNNSEYAIGRSSLLVDKANGNDIVAMASIFQSSPLILLTTKVNEIKTVSDFKDKMIMFTENNLSNTALKAMILSQGLKEKDIRDVKHSYNINDLINQKVDLMTAYSSNEIYYLKEKNIPYKMFSPKDYGFDFYSDILFTSKEEIENNPKRVEDFRSASLKGWEYAFSNIEESVDLILKKYNTQNKNKEILLYEANELKKLTYINSKIELGYLDEKKIEKIYDVFHLLGIIKSKIDLSSFVYRNNQNNKFELTKEEKKYLNTKENIKMCIDPDWLPFEKSLNNQHIGINAEYMQLVENIIQKPIKLINTNTWRQSLNYIKKKECDIVTLVMKTKERESFLEFVKPHFKIPLVLVTRIEEPFINDINEIYSQKLAIVKGYSYKHLLEEKYQSIKFVEVDNLKDGLQKVKDKKVFGLIDALHTTGYNIQKYYVGELKIATKLNKDIELSIGVRKDELQLKEILNKALFQISDNEKEKILNKWIHVQFESKTNYIVILKWVLSVVLIFGIILYFFLKANKKLSAEINKRKLYEEELQRYIYLVDENIITSTTDLKGEITHVSEAFCKISGYTKKELIGKKHNIVRHPDMKKEKFHELWTTLNSDKTWSGEIKNKKKDGDYYWVHATISPIFDNKHNKIGYTSIRQDISDKKRLENMSITDELTQIYNRRYFNEIIEKSINSAKRHNEYLCFCILDIDYFKQYNDYYGHIKGDEVLKLVAKQIKSNLFRADDYCFRLGGEEFGIIIKETSSKNVVEFFNKIKKSIELLKIEHKKSKSDKYLTASFGLTIKKASLIKNELELYKEADNLLYEAKEEGRNKVIYKISD